MRLAVELVKERPGGRAAKAEPGRAATSPTLGAGHRPAEFPRARRVARGIGGLLRLIGEILADRRRRRQRAAAIRELRAWDDRMLKDVGLTRGEIRAAVDGELDRGRPVRRRGS